MQHDSETSRSPWLRPRANAEASVAPTIMTVVRLRRTGFGGRRSANRRRIRDMRFWLRSALLMLGRVGCSSTSVVMLLSAAWSCSTVVATCCKIKQLSLAALRNSFLSPKANRAGADTQSLGDRGRTQTVNQLKPIRFPMMLPCSHPMSVAIMMISTVMVFSMIIGIAPQAFSCSFLLVSKTNVTKSSLGPCRS